ncbi:LAMI_0F01486g1_1 [Lachancea mirantina]|uniref:non-specific serine/threonine protein kinase n=1 Tax=Lachancea mirantina TaxID=1230905 RepID=A0A1G4JVZ7_9SACH|nr:LAMI_0F01486g1_1 [Lachancea mirantina]
MASHTREGSVIKSAISTLKDDRIGPWTLGATLGSGSTGRVVMAQNVESGQQAAVKVVSKAIFNGQNNATSTIVGCSDPDVLPYGIEREIIIMKLLNHSNVLRLYDVWETNKTLYMVLEYVEKGELFNLLVERGPLPENEAVRFFRQIIIGISYCHALGIVHRDLKPENLLLDHKFNIKIADFGMAALESKDKLLETSCGSPHYAAPEIVSGLPYHGFESDVWSCGVILFALLTGRLPFDEEDGNIRNLLLKVQSGHFEMPQDDEISEEAQDLISKILVVDPASRIKTREILRHPLLQKYPSIKDSKSIRNLPREDTYLNPLENVNGVINDAILDNLVVLWHGRNRDEIVQKLREPGANLEKTFYALLHRFKHDSHQEQIKQKRVSGTFGSSPSKAAVRRSNSRRSVNSTVTPKKKNKAPVISASSSHKRPVSFSKLPTLNTPTSKNKRSSVNISSKKRASALVNVNASPTPMNKRMSLKDVDLAAHPIPVDMLKDYGVANSKATKRSSKITKRLSFLPAGKRGSMTTKLIATYAKISEEDDWEFIEKETRRTSADFATLCDQIFEHEKFEQIRKEKEELERRVNEAREKEEREKREREEKQRLKQEGERLEQERLAKEHEDRQRDLQEQLDEEIRKLKADYENSNNVSSQIRSISAPVDNHVKSKNRTSNAELEKEVNDLLNRRTFSLDPRPVSRLDPGMVTTGRDDVDSGEEKSLAMEKSILETIRRSKFLGSSFDIKKELERSRRMAEEKPRVESDRNDQRFASSATTSSTTNHAFESQALPKNAAAKPTVEDHVTDPRKISDVRVPQFTRRSRHFTSSNKRLSVLSLYSSKASYTNLADHLRGGTELNPMNVSAPSSAKVSQEAEFMFESVDGEGRDTAETSADSRLYEISEALDSKTPSKSAIKLNFADRFADDKFKSGSDDDTDMLPTLPPLDKSKSGKINGLGIYQPSKSSDENLSDGEARKANPRSTIQEKDSQDAKETKEIPSEKPSVPSKKPAIQRPKQADKVKQPGSNRMPLTDITPTVEKRRNKSLFGKLSKGNDGKVPMTKNSKLNTTVPEDQMFNALTKLLLSWKDYGLKDVRSVASKRIITGKLSSENLFSLRSTLFEINVSERGTGSCINFTKHSGSSKTLGRLIKEIEKILESKNVLVFSN